MTALNDYLDALRRVAGKVARPGDDGEHDLVDPGSALDLHLLDPPRGSDELPGLESLQIDVETLASMGSRLWIAGEPGSGRSSLLQLAALALVANHVESTTIDAELASGESSRLTVLVDGSELEREAGSSSQIGVALARAALTRARVANRSMSLIGALHTRIQRRPVAILIDDADLLSESVRRRLDDAFPTSRDETQVVVTSAKPAPRGWTPLWLGGLRPHLALSFLEGIFGPASWQGLCVDRLQHLPHGDRILRNPTLLLLAASVARKVDLPDSMLGLCQAMVGSGHPAGDGDDFSARLQAVTQGALRPEEIQAVVDLQRLDQAPRDSALVTLRREIFAARADEPGRPRLRAILRMLACGGGRGLVEEFARVDGSLLGATVLDAIVPRSGRLGEVDGGLCHEAERAFRAMGRIRDVLPAAQRRWLTTLPGWLGDEARILAWTLGDRADVDRDFHPSRALRAAMALRRSGQPDTSLPTAEVLETDPVVRIAALRALAKQVGDIAALAAALLDDPDPDVRAASIDVMARRGDLTRDEVFELLDGLRDEEPAVRSAAVRACRKSNVKVGEDLAAAYDLLGGLLPFPVGSSSDEAAEAGADEDGLTETEDEDVLKEVIGVLAEATPAYDAVLRGLLERGSWAPLASQIRLALFGAVESTLSPPEYRRYFDDGDAAVQAAAVRGALATYPELAREVTQILDDPERSLLARCAAVDALAKTWGAALFLERRSASRPPPPELDARLIAAAGASGRGVFDQGTLEMLLQDPAPEVRAEAVRVAGTDGAMRLVLTAFGDPSAAVRKVALLECLRWVAEGAALQDLAVERVAGNATDTRPREGRGSREPRRLPLETAADETETEWARLSAIREVAGREDARPVLAALTRHGQPRLREVAARALLTPPPDRQWTARDVLDRLVELTLTDRDAGVASAVIGSGFVAAGPSVSTLEASLRYGDRGVRSAAVRWLGIASDGERRALLDDLQAVERDPQVRQAIAVARIARGDLERRRLQSVARGGIGSLRAATHRVAIRSAGGRVPSSVEGALASVDEGARAEAVGALVDATDAGTRIAGYFADPSEDVVVAAIGATMSSPPARAEAAGLLGHPSDRVRAMAVLALALTPGAEKRLMVALDDEAPGVRAAAVQALGWGAGPNAERDQAIGDLAGDAAGIVRAEVVAILGTDARDSWLLNRLGDGDERVRAAAMRGLRGRVLTSTIRSRAAAMLGDQAAVARAAAASVLSGAATSAGGGGRDTASGPDLSALASGRGGWLRSPLRVLGADPSPDSAASHEMLLAEEQLSAFVTAPSPRQVSGDDAFDHLLCGWLLARLGVVGEPGHARLFGQPDPTPATSEDRSEPVGRSYVLHVAALDAEVRAGLRMRPLLNLLRAHRVARFLTTNEVTSFWLCCADVPRDELQPPVLEPGGIHRGPTWFGFALRQLAEARSEASQPERERQGATRSLARYVTSADARALWSALTAEDRAVQERALADLATRKDLDIWTLIPFLDRTWDLLPPVLSQALLGRLREAQGGGPLNKLDGLRRDLGLEKPRVIVSSESHPRDQLWDRIDALAADSEPAQTSNQLAKAIGYAIRDFKALQIPGYPINERDWGELLEMLNRAFDSNREPSFCRALLRAVEGLPIPATEPERESLRSIRNRLALASGRRQG